MKYVWKYAGIYIAFIIQSLFLENLKIFSCSPDILTAFVIGCSVSMNFGAAAALGAFSGLLMDVMYGEVFGINILIYMYLALLVSLATDEKNANSPLIMAWISFVSVSAMEIVLAVLKAALGGKLSIENMCANIFVKGLFATVFMLVSVLIQQRIKKSGKEKNTLHAEPEKEVQA